MPPSPAMHRSPSAKSTGSHNRGRSFESLWVFREKDDDLALFNDMSARERETFLLPCANEDLDDSITTELRDFSDFKKGVTVPARDGSVLLDADGEKNDYDWLLTPPDTPLFPSLDDESAPPPNLQERGRPRSQPISISRSNTMEKSQSSRASRTSASPQRLSPSSKSSTSTPQSRVRPSSAPNSAFVHPLTPQRMPSTPPGKPDNQTPARRMSTGSSGYGSLSRRGTSPVNANRGTSSSPKLSAWHTNLPGFSSGAPPNLRTSLPDRPSSYAMGSSPASRNGRERGTSPASRNGRETSSMYGRRSTSPAVSRGTSSPRSHDRFSSNSKGSIGSSCDDEVESIQSTLPSKHIVFPGSTRELVAKRHESFSSPKGSAYSKRASRTISAISAPKPCFDSAMRQMDRHKSPQRMFRPMLSSVPSTSFYVGKANTFHQHLVAVSSTATSSSNTNFEWGASGVPDTDGSDHERDDLVYEWEKVPFYVNKEVLSSEKDNDLNNDSLHMGLHAADMEGFGSVLCSNASSDFFDACGGSEERVSENITFENIDEEANIFEKNGSVIEADNFGNLITCSKCGEKFLEMEILDERLNVCQSCIIKDEYMCSYLQSQPDHAGIDNQAKDTDLEVKKQTELGVNVDDCFGICAYPLHDGNPDNGPVQLRSYEEHDTSWLPDRELEQPPVNSSEQNSEANYITKAPKNGPETVDFMQYWPQSDNCSTLDPQVKDANAYPSSILEASEGTGISLLLVRSTNIKQPVVHGKTLSTSSISYDGPSYMTNSFNSMRGLSNASFSSSVSTDTASARQTGAHFQWQPSPRKSDLESPRTDIHSDLQNKPLHAGVQICSFKIEVCVMSPEDLVVAAEGMVLEDILSLHNEKCSVLENVNSDIPSLELSASEHNDPPVKQVVPMDAYSLGPSNNAELVQLVEISEALLDEACLVAKHCNLDENAEDCYPNSSENMLQRDLTIPKRKSFVDMDERVLTNQLNVVDKASKDSLDTVSGVQENVQVSLTRSYSNSAGCQSDNILDQELSTAPAEEVDATCAVLETSILDHSPSSKEEGTRKMEDLKRCLSRNTTFEEATDTILFCRSIVHDLAYKAATIAIEKDESLCIEDSRPTVTIPARSGPIDTRAPSVPHGKRAPRLQKPKSKEQPKKIDDSAFAKTEMEVFYKTKIHHVTEPNQVDSTKPPKLESKCNCSIM